ncbi:hypothetical protein ELG88_09810 [Rhizobium leguminosarum]|uniref:tape measure protein n=1 Tax=Rhizobium leguminosarum TaxID=384 RepID=UPI00102F756C|nr:tape measure protein [Rhizobium leguminosarum]TAY66554.1 hypothetical protein ELH82_10335 [Rhizobium leguminosarum]TBF35481.1 hypothetical protein ELG88_09810 [Rhizobium leguminosarum]
MIVDELIAILGYETKGEGELKRFQQSIDQTAKRITIFAAAATAAAAGALALLGKSVISTAAQFESYAATLETIEGSSEKAKKALDWVSKFGAKTPYEVGEVTEAFVRLKAYGIDPTTGALEAVGDASSAMGKTLMQGVEAIADAATGEFERLKEFGITSSVAGDKVTFNWTKNSKTLSKTVKKNSAEIIQFLKENFGDRFNGAMLRQSKTWNGMVSNLGDAWTGFLREIGDAGVFETAKEQLAQLLYWMQRASEDGTLKRWAQRISAAMETIADVVATVVDRVQTHFLALSRFFERHEGIFDGIKYGLAAIAAIKFPFLSSLLILDDLLTWAEGGDSVIGKFAEVLGELTGIDADKLDTIIATLAGATALAAAASSVGLLTAALNPLTAALIGLGAAFAGAKVALDYFGVAKADLDKKVAATTAADNPRAKPGYVEGMGGIYMKGAAVVDQPRPPNLEDSMTKDALDWKLMMQNAEGNAAKMGGGAPANAVVNDNKQDNRNQSVQVNVGGVQVNGVAGAGAAVGAAVGNAVGQAAAGGARASRFEKDDAF